MKAATKEQIGYAGEKPERICMFTPSGQRWFDDHDKATAAIRSDYPAATRVRRWTENGIQYEDYKDCEGIVLAQLEFAGPPVLAAGFTYE